MTQASPRLAKELKAYRKIMQSSGNGTGGKKESHIFRFDRIMFLIGLVFCTLALSGVQIVLYAGVVCLWVAAISDFLEGEDKK